MKRIAILLFMVSLVWACTNTEAGSIETKETSEIKMAEWSELALLMRQIHKDAKQWRKSIDHGELVHDSIAIYELLTESTPTDEDVTGPIFEGFAKNYQLALDSLMQSQDINLAKENYNNLVSTCISCHTTYCPGPVKTIKKLYFPEN